MHALLQRLLNAIQRCLKLAVIRPSARILLRLFSWLHSRISRYTSADANTRHRASKLHEEKDPLSSHDLHDITYCSEAHDLQSYRTQTAQTAPVSFVADSRDPISSPQLTVDAYPLQIIPSPPTIQISPAQPFASTSNTSGPRDSPEPYDAERKNSENSDDAMVSSPEEEQGRVSAVEPESPTAQELPEQLAARQLGDTNKGFRPLVPDNVGRYDRTATAEEDCWTFPIKAFRTTFLDELQIPGWTIYTHPEGSRVFYHEEQRIFTEVDLFNGRIRLELESYATALYDYLRAVNRTLDEDVHIVFELMPRPEDELAEDGSLSHYICNYYLVKHDTRTVFWLDDFDASEIPVWNEVMGVEEPAHVHHLIEASYWYHCSLYPTSRPWSTTIVDEMRDILVHGIIDTMTSPTSTAPYSVSDLQQMLSVMNSMRKTVGPGIGAMASLSRLMNFFVQQRFYNHHGQPHARLDRDKTVYSSTPATRHSPLITLISPLLFSAPDVHLRSLEKTWVDRIIHHTAYNNLVTKLTSEWQEFILYATVLLNANVAFLAIQSIDEEAHLPQRSAAQLASYVSILASIGSIILGLLLVRQNRTKTRESATEAANYLAKWHHARLGLETLAILWSLPYALLMWAMLSFLLSISFLSFQNTTNYIRAGLGTFWCLIAVLIVWCITTSWETRATERNFTDDWLDMLTRVVSLLTPKFLAKTESESVEGKSTEGDVVSIKSPSRKVRWRSRLSTLLSIRRLSVNSDGTDDTVVDSNV